MGASLQGGGGRSNRRQRAVMSEINVTPFVDVMLVLLIIFMVTAPMLTSGVAVDLPKSNARALAGEDEPISVSILKDGRIFLQKREITSASELTERLKAITGENAEARIFIRAAKSLDYGKVMQVMGQVNAAGYRRVALVTDKQS